MCRPLLTRKTSKNLKLPMFRTAGSVGSGKFKQYVLHTFWSHVAGTERFSQQLLSIG